MKIRHKVWLESNGETIFCKGRGKLLRTRSHAERNRRPSFSEMKILYEALESMELTIVICQTT